MPANIPLAVRHVIEEYRSFLRTSYHFLAPELRKQFETHLAAGAVVVHGPYVTLSRDLLTGPTLPTLVQSGGAHPDLLRMRWAFGSRPLYRHQERSFAANSGTVSSNAAITCGRPGQRSRSAAAAESFPNHPSIDSTGTQSAGRK